MAKTNKWLPFVTAMLGGPMGAKAAMAMKTAQKSGDLSKMSTEDWKGETGFEDFQTPKSYLDYLGLSKTQTRQEMPGLQAMKGDIAQSTAQALSGAQNLDAGSSAAVLLGAQQNRLSALRQLGIAASQYRERQGEEYRQAIGQGSQYEQQAYEYNKWLPWQMKQNLQQGYNTASMDMTENLLDQGMAMGFQGANMNAMQNWYNNNNPYGQNTGSVPTTYTNPQWPTPSINQMGQQQVAPAANLGSASWDPYANAQQGSNPNPFSL